MSQLFHFLLYTYMTLDIKLKTHKQLWNVAPTLMAKSFEATDFSLIMSTCSNEVSEMMNRGVSHGTLAQFDKHSDEHSLQRISEPVTEACKEVGKLVRTDIPETVCGLQRTMLQKNFHFLSQSPKMV